MIRRKNRMAKKSVAFLFAVPVLLCVCPAYSASGSPAPYGPMRQWPPSPRRSPLIISEIMYHPLDRADDRNLEFVELFNTEPVDWDISGFRLEGQIDYTFPAGSILRGRSFAVVAAEPASVEGQ